MGFFSRRRKQAQRIADVEAELDRARTELTRVIREQTETSSAEIQRLLARERADTLSRLEEEERKIAEERRRDILERERQAGSELNIKLAEAQERVEQRYASWSADLDRTHQALTAELKKLAERQKALVGQAETRLQDDREKIDEAESSRSPPSRSSGRSSSGPPSSRLRSCAPSSMRTVRSGGARSKR